MPSLSQFIVDNVDCVSPSYIETYLKQKGIVKTEKQLGLKLCYWVDSLFKENKIDIFDFEDFLFEELFWGKRKSIRIFKLVNSRCANLPKDWLSMLEEKYSVSSLDFKNILGTIPNSERNLKIAAITSEVNYKGELSKLRILFVKLVEVNVKHQYEDSIAYIPTEIDFVKKILILKVWNRTVLAEDYRPDELMNHIGNILSINFKIKTKSFQLSHKKALHNMSRGLIAEIYQKIPAYKKITNLIDTIKMFEQDVYKELGLENVTENDGIFEFPKSGFDFYDEIAKVLGKLAISDYFFDRSYEEIWNMGVDTIISKIRFNDAEHILTSLNGEATEVPIFCSKTFMALLKSMEDAEVVERIWISKNRKRGKLELRYDATNEDYLGIMILSNIRFKQEDLIAALEIYESYESGVTKPITKENQQDAV